MKFYDRENELGILEKAYQKPGAELIILTGRRRVGKSRIIHEFTKDKKAISLLIVPKEEKQIAKDIENEIRAKFGYSPVFNSLREAMDYIFAGDFRLLCIDEFPNVLSVNSSIPYELQARWDKKKETKDLMIVVSGSFAGMMKKIFTAKKAPLFNRATKTINVKPLDFRTVFRILENLGVSNPVEKASYFCILGGIPYYYILLEKQDDRSFESAISNLFFEQGSQLREEGENVLRQEFGNAYTKYYAILEAIQGGHVSMNEISQRIGLESTTMTKYLTGLQKDFRLVERTIPYDQNPLRSKKGIYSISDNTLAFWFSHVYGKMSIPTSEEINAFIGKRFETLCRDFAAHKIGQQERIIRTGKWWGLLEVEKKRSEQREIDLIVETDKCIYFGECKWKSEKTGQKDLERLIETSEKAFRTNKERKFLLFSKTGFRPDVSEKADKFDLKEISAF